MNMPLILAARHLPKAGTKNRARRLVEPLALKEMVNANHDYRGEW